MSKLNVLVLGGSGFVGKELITNLLLDSSTYTVTALQHLTKLHFADKNFSTIVGNMGSLTHSKLKEINPDIVFHLARNNSKNGILGRYIASLKGYYANREFLKNLNQLNKPVKVIYLSGSLMYGEGIHHENSTIKPTSFARQYVIAESPLLIPQRYTNLFITMVRVPWILGNGSWFKTFYHQQINATQLLQCYSPDQFNMQVISVEDCASNLIRLSKLNHTGVYNLFMPTAIKYKQFIEEIALAYGVKNILPFDKNWLHGKFEKAIYEAFTKEILMTTINTDIQSKMVFTDATSLEMLQRKLASFTHHE